MTRLFAELKRRNVFRVGIAYLITAWLIAQVLELVFDSFGAPDWAIKAVLAILAAGLPLVLIFSWIFELTPEGIKRDSEVDHSGTAAAQTSHKLNRAIIVVLVLALAYFVWESRFAGDANAPSQDASVAQEQVAPAQTEESTPVAPATDKSVAVLPFMNMSSDQEQEYFSDGITEEVINALVKIPGLSIPARTSVFAYKGRLQDVREIGRELNVAHVLEGSIRSQGKQVRITAQLINVESGYHLWSETFDRQLENIFAVQEEIAGAIAEVLVGELGVGIAAVPNQTRDMEAYDLYLQGRAALRNREDEATAIFEQVTQRDPGFAPGWAALAMAHNSVDDNDEAAMTAATRALSMDPENVDALNAMGAALRGLRRWAEAEATFDRALTIDPSSAELLEDYAEFLNFVGRTDEALEVTTRAMAIEPGLRPLQQEHASALLAAGRIEDAMEMALLMLDMRGPWGWYYLLPAWMAVADQIGSSAEIPDRPDIPGEEDLPADVRDALNTMTSEDLVRPSKAWASEMRSRLEVIMDYPEQREVFWIYSMIRGPMVKAGEIDFVIGLDSRVNEQFSRGSFEWTWTPMLKPLREHPGFARHLEQVGLVEYWDATSWPKWCQRNEDGVITCH